jgi:hypothetical protein
MLHIGDMAKVGFLAVGNSQAMDISGHDGSTEPVRTVSGYVNRHFMSLFFLGPV